MNFFGVNMNLESSQTLAPNIDEDQYISKKDELLYDLILELSLLKDMSKKQFSEWLCSRAVLIAGAKYCIIYLFDRLKSSFEIFKQYSQDGHFDCSIVLPNQLVQYLEEQSANEDNRCIIINDIPKLARDKGLSLDDNFSCKNILFIRFNRADAANGYIVLTSPNYEFDQYDLKRIRLLLVTVWNLYSNKLTMDLVKEVNEMQKITLSAIPDMLFIINAQGEYLDVFASNQGDLLGSPNSLIGTNVSDLFEATLAAKFIDNIKLVVSEQVNREIEYSVEVNGQQKYYEARLIPYQNETVFVLARDISSRKNAEIALLEVEKKYKSIIDVSSEWIWEINIEKKYVYVSPKVYDILGYMPEELIGKKTSEILYKGKISELESFNDLMNFRKAIIGFEHRYYHKSGRIVYIDTNAIPVYDHFNHFIGYRGADKDISGRKLIEEKLIESEEKYRTLTEYLPVGIYKTDLSGKIIYANQTICKMLGYANSDELKKVNAEDTFLNPATRVNFVEQLNKSNKPIVYESQLLTKHGNIIWVRETSSGMRNDVGEIVYVQGILEDITSEKKANEELMFSENKYRSIFDAAPDATLLVDQENGKIIDANATACRLYLYSLNELMKIHLNELDSGNISDIYLKAGLWQVPIKFHRKKNGDIFPVEISSSYHIQRGRKIATVMIRDISNRIATEQALFESEERFRGAFEKSSIGMAIISLNGNFITANNALSSMLGYAEEELRDKSFSKLCHPDDYQECSDLLKRMVDKRIPYLNTERRFVNRAREIVWVEIDKTLIFSKNGMPLHFVTLFKDITDKRMAEAKLRESEERFRALANQLPILIWTSGLDKLCDWFNDYWLKFTGRTMQQEMGNGWMENVHPDDVDLCIATYVKNFDNRTPFIMHYRLKSKDGIYRIVEDMGSPRFSSDGAFLGYIGAVWDVEDRINAEKEIIDTKNALEEANQVKTIILGNLGHELRTPLNAILGFSQIINDSSEDKDIKDFSSAILNSSRRLERTLNSLLILSELEAKKRDLSLINSNLNIFMENFIAVFNEIINNSKIEFEYDPGSDVLEVDIDEYCLHLIMFNILDNAFKFTKSGKVSLCLNKVNVQNEVFALVKVIDTGIGISKDKIVTIFEAFRQESEGISRNYEGLGIGLTVTKKLTEMMKGKINIESEENKGTTVSLMFPVVSED